jgi:hypothetical protein
MYYRKKASLARGELRRLNATRRGQEEVWNLAGGTITTRTRVGNQSLSVAGSDLTISNESLEVEDPVVQNGISGEKQVCEASQQQRCRRS